MNKSVFGVSSDVGSLGAAAFLALAASAFGVCYTQGGTVNCCSRITAGGPVSDYGCGLFNDHPCPDLITSNPAVQTVQQVTRGKTAYTADDGFQCKWRTRGCSGPFGSCKDASTTESTAGCTSDTPSGDPCRSTSGGGPSGPIALVTPTTNS